jgi:hypothetical protein
MISTQIQNTIQYINQATPFEYLEEKAELNQIMANG